MLELCKNAHSLYLSETDEEKRKLVNLLCSNLSFDGSNIRVELKSVFNIFIENASRRLNLGRNVEVRTFDRAQKIAEALAKAGSKAVYVPRYKFHFSHIFNSFRFCRPRSF